MIPEGNGSRETSCINAIDTNVLVYAIDYGDPLKQAKAVSLARRFRPNDALPLWRVAAEYLSCIRRFAAAEKSRAADVEVGVFNLLQAFPRVDTWILFFPRLHARGDFSEIKNLSRLARDWRAFAAA